jgi:hypothetical protein
VLTVDAVGGASPVRRQALSSVPSGEIETVGLAWMSWGGQLISKKVAISAEIDWTLL